MLKQKLALGVAVMVLPVVAVLGQVSIEPPPQTATASAPEVPPAATLPAESKTTDVPHASTLPSAENVLENLLHDKPPVTPVAPKSTTVTGPATAVPALLQVAGNEPKSKMMRERKTVEKRAGRLVKDKNGNWVFVFDADGKDMNDAPLTILPSLMLEAMEGLSDNGVKAVKFRVSGEVTQYRGRNYLLIRYAQVVKDLNQGLGG